MKESGLNRPVRIRIIPEAEAALRLQPEESLAYRVNTMIIRYRSIMNGTATGEQIDQWKVEESDRCR